MGQHHYDVPVYTIDVFDASAPAFWMSEAARLNTSYPFLDNPFRQTFYSILYLQEGNGILETDKRSVTLGNNQLCCCAPHSINSLQVTAQSKGFFVAFTAAFYSLRYHNNILHRFSFFRGDKPGIFNLPSTLSVKWQELFSFMSGEFRDKPRNEQVVLRSYLNILLQDIERLETEQQGILHSSTHEKVETFLALLETGYQQQKSPSFYADQLYITAHYLNKLCKTATGLTSSELIQNRVMTEAKRLLLHSRQTVSEIAYELGFESLSYFITFFRKRTGHTPENYRKKI